MKKLVALNFKVKETHGEDTVIEGWANKAVVDRGNDIINKEAWDLGNYGKNAIILYNHDKDKPIGKALDVHATDEGLYIQARISKSKDPFISYVRDMIREGILNSFSVGFDAKHESKNAAGVNEIKKAELYEVSIVTLPMNQDSQFRMSSKEMKKLSYKQVKENVLKEKGAFTAAVIHSRIEDLKALGTWNEDTDLARATELAGGTPEQLAEILAGELVPVPETWLKSFAEVLELDIKALTEAEAAAIYSEETQKTEDTLPESIASTVEHTEAVCETDEKQQENIEEKQALAPNTPPTGGTSGIMEGDDNPYLTQAKQTNVLLGTLISAVQDLSAKMDRVVEVPKAQEVTEVAAVETTEDARFNEVKATLDQARLKLKNLGIHL